MSSDWPNRLADIAAERAGAAPYVLGLCGPQGSGKSTAALAIQARLEGRGLSTAILSLDDLYLTGAERAELARTVHPLLATRGPPGTHDVDLGHAALDAVGKPGTTALPRFDKTSDDRAPQAVWPIVTTPIRVVIFEGWCVGARPQPPTMLETPVNVLEATEDQDATWRTFANAALAGPYQSLFGRIDYFALLRAPAFEQVLTWRTQQEDALRAAGGSGAGIMDATAMARFIQHYERLTRWIDAEAPARADMVVKLGPERNVLSSRFR